MLNYVRITDLNLTGKRVLLREDYNVPLKNGDVADDTRIRASVPTIRQLMQAGATTIIVSHLGRPKEGKFDEAFSMAPVARRLSTLLGREVRLVRNWIKGIDLTAGEVVLCENARFETGEKANDEELSRHMAELCDIYVNDAFATAHRAQASTSGVVKYVPVACAGPLLINELEALTKVLKDPARPLVAIVGGSKVSTKLTILEALSRKVDQLIVGGGIANTFLRAAGYNIGNSLHEPDLVNTAKELMTKCEKNNCAIPLPVDVICAKEYSENARAETKPVEAVENDDLIMDVGPRTTDLFAGYLAKASTIVWNGPLGVFEFDQFSTGTKALAEAIAGSAAFSIAGGGDTIAAIARFGIADRISYISTGGGAFLEFLEGKQLPAVAMLEESARAWTAMEQAREY